MSEAEWRRIELDDNDEFVVAGNRQVKKEGSEENGMVE